MTLTLTYNPNRKTFSAKLPNTNKWYSDIVYKLPNFLKMSLGMKSNDIKQIYKTILSKKIYKVNVNKNQEKNIKFLESCKSKISESGRINLQNGNIYNILQDLSSTIKGNIKDKIPMVEKNVELLQRRLKSSYDIPRNQMPVIKRGQVLDFKKDLEAGNIDVNKPFARGGQYFPTKLSTKEGQQWLTLGRKDGSIKDDKIKCKLSDIVVARLKPTQSQIWLDVIQKNISKFGLELDKNDAVMIASKEGYILDGHHRYARQMINDPQGKLKVLMVPFDISYLIKVARSYGAALGNKQNENTK